MDKIQKDNTPSAFTYNTDLAVELTQLRRREIKSPAGFSKVMPKSTWGKSKRMSIFD